jgi:hypothetical protein
VGSGDNTEGPLGKIAGIYRVNSDGTIEALESARVEAAEKASLFLTDEGIVVVTGNAQVSEELPGQDWRQWAEGMNWSNRPVRVRRFPG